jgi:hypothetical protein
MCNKVSKKKIISGMAIAFFTVKRLKEEKPYPFIIEQCFPTIRLHLLTTKVAVQLQRNRQGRKAG